MPGMDSWLWQDQLKQIRQEVPWAYSLRPPPSNKRPQQHVAEQLVKNNKNINTCGNCMFAYRSDKQGLVMCGNKNSGRHGDQIKKPFEENCRKWRLRRKEQPPVYADQKKNQQLARYAYYVKNVNPYR